MLTKVVDASALAAVIFAEASDDVVAAQVRDCELVAPALLDFELVNVCISKMRRMPADRERLLAGYRARWTLGIETMDVDHVAVLALAQRTGLTGYDASYLHLAQTLGIELVTLDRKLAQAAETFR
ncbi:MAG: type II toxin-antitoxin system VapC family toxin [Acetobacteraceae bacterium]